VVRQETSPLSFSPLLPRLAQRALRNIARAAHSSLRVAITGWQRLSSKMTATSDVFDFDIHDCSVCMQRNIEKKMPPGAKGKKKKKARQGGDSLGKRFSGLQSHQEHAYRGAWSRLLRSFCHEMEEVRAKHGRLLHEQVLHLQMDARSSSSRLRFEQQLARGHK